MTNDVSVTADTADPDPSNNVDSLDTVVSASADLAIDKSGPATAGAGETVMYELDVSNLGPSDADTVEVTDTLPAGVFFESASGSGWLCVNAGDASVTCTRPSLAAGPAPPITIEVTAPEAATVLTNEVEVLASTPDPDLSNNDDSVDTTITALADLSVSKGAPASVGPGESVLYTLDVSNAGPSDAADVSVTDALPAGVTFASAMGAGWLCSNDGNTSVTCTRPALAVGPAPSISVEVSAPERAATLVNGASVSAVTADPDGSNNSDSATTEVAGAADLSLAKTGPASVDVGGEISYRLTVNNAGPDAASDVVVTDMLPDGVTYVSAQGDGWACANDANVTVTCTRPSLASDASAPGITLVVKAPSSATRITNNADVSATTFDPKADNNASTAATGVLGSSIDTEDNLPGTGGTGRGAIWVGLLLVGVGVALRLVRSRSPRVA